MTFVRYRMAQSTAARRHLPAARTARFLLLIGVFAASTGRLARAQQPATVSRAAEPFVSDIGGPRLGQITEGSSFAAGTVRGNNTQITLEGWVFKPSLQT